MPKVISIGKQNFASLRENILLDEYDTPMQEAYLHGYWWEFTAFIRNFFNATFKTNPYLERAVLTGITQVSKESVFSDLNNLNVVTTSSTEYETSFGFTEEEVFQALEDLKMGEQKELVKSWYDGFVFGNTHDIYNPWSITNFLDKKQVRPYWADTSSNSMIDELIRKASTDIKEKMEELLQGKEIVVNFDEQIVFEQLDNYNQFMKALLSDDIDAMNYYMNQIIMTTFSYFDVGQNELERFYHGFVLGLIADQTDIYEIRSNRESGFGRYDVMMIPKIKETKKYPAIIMEFKVRNIKREESLEDTVQTALTQIKEKCYDAELYDRGLKKEEIHHYGFAFEGKKVLIG
ncbi:AAA family ATPase [Coprococcus comes]|nr:AAA family ATPase [Coprococcus comes]